MVIKYGNFRDIKHQIFYTSLKAMKAIVSSIEYDYFDRDFSSRTRLDQMNLVL